MMKKAAFLKLLIVFFFLAGLALPPVAFNPVAEFFAPALIIFLFLLAFLVCLVLYGFFSSVFPIIGVIIVSVVVFLSKKMKSHVRQPGDTPAPSASRLAVVFRRGRLFFAGCFVSGVIVTGYLIDPNPFSLTVLLGLFIASVAGLIMQKMKRDSDLFNRVFKNRASLILSIAVAVPVVYFAPGGVAFPAWLVLLVTVIIFAFFIAVNFSGGNKPADTVQRVAAISFFAGLAIVAGFVFEVAQPPEPHKGVSRVIEADGGIYDVEYDSTTGRLYFSRNKWDSLDSQNSFLEYVNVKTGETGLAGGTKKIARRIAIFPDRNLAFIGGSGVTGFSGDLKSKLLFPESRTNVDLENVNDRLLLIAHEASSEITVYDLDTSKAVPVFLPGIFVWPYSLEYSPGSNAFFVSNWLISPFIYRVTLDGYKVDRRTNGLFNMGTCSDPARGKLYVARPLHRRLDVLDARTLDKISTIPVQFGVRELECDPASGLLFAQNQFRGIISVIDVEKEVILEQLRFAKAGRSLSYDPDNGILYTGNNSGIFAIDVKRELPDYSVREEKE